MSVNASKREYVCGEEEVSAAKYLRITGITNNSTDEDNRGFSEDCNGLYYTFARELGFDAGRA